MRRKTVLVPLVATLVLVAGVTAWADDDDPPGGTPSGAADLADMADMPGMTPTSSAAPSGPAAPAAGTVEVKGDSWKDPKTWGGKVPGAGDVATIPAGRTVVLDTTATVKGVVVKGNLVAGGTAAVGITADYIAVKGGRLQVGTEAAPFAGRATFTLTGSGTADTPNTAGMGNKVLAVDGGVLDLHGAKVATNWTRLAADVAAGGKTLTLAAAPGWKAGDEIVVATSTSKQADYDKATVASVSGTTVTLSTALAHKHFGTIQRIGDSSIDVRAEVGLLSHNIVITGDAASASSKVGAHAMIMGKSTARIADVEITKAGQYDHLGRYPLHFHMMGNQCSGCYAKQVSVHDTIQRGIVVHATSGITLDGNVVYNTVGHNVILETADTIANTVSNNLALVNREPNPAFKEATLATQNDKNPSTFWFKSTANKITGNAAGGSESNGFIYDLVETKQPIDFTKNSVHAAEAAESKAVPGESTVQGGVVVVSDVKRPANDVLSGFTVYSSGIGVWPEESGGPYKFSDFTLAANDLQMENRGVGNYVTYTRGTWIKSLADGSGKDGRASHIQYGSEVLFDKPHFVGYTSSIELQSTDTRPHQNTYTVTAPTFSPSKPKKWILNDATVTEFTDSAAVPKGVYMAKNSPSIGTKACSTASAVIEENSGFQVCPARYHYTELDYRDMAAPGTSLAGSVNVVRSDGSAYHRGTDSSEEPIGLGLYYTLVSYDQGMTYTLGKAASRGMAVGLSTTFSDGSAQLADVRSGKTTVQVAVPVTGAPSKVLSTNVVDERDGEGAVGATTPSATGTALKAVASASALTPGTYYYDAAKKQVVVLATSKWIVIQ